MASGSHENAIRNYLTAIKDPKSLRDDDHIAGIEKELAAASDPVERVKLRQQLQDARTPSAERFEEAFVAHARDWADSHGISAAAFLAEGVPTSVLRRAGFSVRGGRRGPGRPRKHTGRSRVSAEEVRAALPRGTFTIRTVQEATGASTGVVRRVIQEELEAGNLATAGADPDHKGPGRAPTLYKR